MKKSCVYCGGIHDGDYICTAKEQTIKEQLRNRNRTKETETEEYKFYQSTAWKRKRNEIVKRDLCLCQSCLNIIKDDYGLNLLTYRNLSVHHIKPLKDNWDKRLDGDNLITLCNQCHVMAENGEIDEELLLEIAKRNQDSDCCIPWKFKGFEKN